jgi:DNA-binding MarR family transcriptional regulator
MPIRLSILALLAEVHEAEFSYLMETVEINAPTCSKQVSLLEDAGFIKVRKGAVGRRPRTWLSLTPAGRQALTGYLQTLQSIAGTAVQPRAPADPENS